MIHEAATLDMIYHRLAIAKDSPSLKQSLQGSPDDLLELPLRLRETVTLYKCSSGSPSLRDRLLEKDPEYWTENPPAFHSVAETFVIYRVEENHMIIWSKISKEEYNLLSLFQNPLTLEDLFVKQQENESFESAQENLQEWFQKWTALEWLGAT